MIPGSYIKLDAKAAPGWRFSRWDVNLSDVPVEKNPLELSVISDLNIKAVFAPRWNFLVYMAADNNLEQWADGVGSFEGDLQEMVRAGFSENVDVLVLLDRYSVDGTSLYRLTKTSDGTGSEFVPLESYGELDMSDPAVLENFLVYAAERFPAEYTVLTLWNHGSGVYPRGIAYDSTTASSGTGDRPFFCLTTDDVEHALKAAREKTGSRPVIIHTDACLMQMAEIAWQWQGEASYLVGSPAFIPTLGNDYTELLTGLSLNPDITPGDYAVHMTKSFIREYSSYSNLNLSFSTIALDGRFDAFRTAFSAFSTSLHAGIDTFRGDAETARAGSTDYGDLSAGASQNSTYSEFVDLGDFLRRFSKTPGGAALSSEILSLQTAIAGMLPSLERDGRYSGDGDLPSSGISVLLPPSRNGNRSSPGTWTSYERNGYGILKMPSETSWDEFLTGF